MVTYRALYYPYIHFKDETWVKAAALYWDQLGRIVPYGGYQLEDTAAIQRLRGAGFVTEFVPRGSETAVSAAFQQLIDEWKAPLKAKYSIHRVGVRRGGAADYAAPEWADPDLAYVSVGKVDPALRQLLTRESLAADSDRGGWIGMHPRLVAVYMTSLAQVMAGEHGAHPMTDEVIDHVSVAGLDVTHIAQALLDDVRLPVRTDREVEEAMVAFAIESVLPSRLADMPVDEIIDIRERHGAQRAAFQAGMSELVSSLSHMTGGMSAEDFEWHVRNEHEKHVKVPLDELKQSLKDNHVETAVGLIGTQFAVPAGFGAVLGLVGVTLAPPVGVTIGIG
jgi:Family of unknown function (DUF6236)